MNILVHLSDIGSYKELSQEGSLKVRNFYQFISVNNFENDIKHMLSQKQYKKQFAY